MGGDAYYLGDIYSKDDLIKIVANYNGCLSYIKLIIQFWEENLCPDCGAPIKTENYINKCSAKPDKHLIGDAEFYIKKIKERLIKDAIYIKRK